ncbi:MAG: Veg family protein [Clostridia bacterium]|nr:Veg protein [Oscillospiraceae bacterium]MBQ7033261.1 Veg family protein [Clostridia bacterium]
MVRSDLEKMKKNLDSIVGQEIQLTARRGRKRAITRKGVIEKTYPSIFIVRLENTRNSTIEGRRISFSYADVLTRAIEVTPYRAAQ